MAINNLAIKINNTDHDKIVKSIEDRFKNVAGLDLDMSVFPLKPNKNSQVETNKIKSKEFSEVFTPLWLADKMIKQAKYGKTTQTLDLCAGFGQFSVRLMRAFANAKKNFNIDDFFTNHYFSELQISSCYKLLYIFGTEINLFVGDSTYLNKLPKEAKGIWCYVEEFGYWACIDKTIEKILKLKKSEDHKIKVIEETIKYLNGVYKTMSKLTIEMFKRDAHTRLGLIKEVKKCCEGAWQDVETPKEIVADMLKCLDKQEYNSILVLFNTEIVEQLVHNKKIDPSKITFATDILSELAAKYVKAVYGVDYKLFKTGDIESIRNAMGGKKFDVVLSNPPYNRGVDLKILLALLTGNMAKEYIIVHPSTWLLDQKGKKQQYLRLKEIINDNLRSVRLFNGNGVFGIELFVPCTITHIDLERKNNRVDVCLFDDKFEVSSVNDITKFGSNWPPMVKPFLDKMVSVVARTGNIWDHNETVVNPDKHYCQLAAIRGDVRDRGKNKVSQLGSKQITTDNFYTMLIDLEANKGIREPRLDKPGGHTPTFGFATEIERDNFLSYLNTDFARFCLAQYKIGQHLENGELELIPWLDFTQPWDDAKLFAHFDINKETQDYIRSFLPDYYGIRK